MRRKRLRKGLLSKLGLTVAAFALLAAACGSGDDDGGGSGESAEGETTESTAEDGNNFAENTSTTEPEGGITPGGKITYALEAENATGFSPQFSQMPIAGYTVLRAVYDPLMAYGADGKIYPYLAESMTPSPDFKQWKIKVKSGIKFHDGLPLDGAAVVANIEGHRCSPLTATALGEFGGCPATFDPNKPEDPATNRKPLSTLIAKASVDPADPLTAVVDFLIPYAVFDATMTEVIGYIASPSMFKDPKNSPKNPQGTGPFKFKEWVPNDHLTVVKNPDYWQSDPDGVKYPYLDEIEFRPIDDIAARENALRSGQVNVMQTSNGDNIATFREDWTMFENDRGGETGYFMINHFPTYKGQENPLADVRVRKCLAHGIDRDKVNELRNANVTTVASGPYPPGTIGYLEDAGYPKFDIAAGKKLCDEYKAEKGITGDIQIAFGTTADPFNKGTNELVASMWKEVGVTATIDQTEQGAYIGRALAGDFQVFGWRNHGGFNPDTNFIWWHSSLAIDPPGTALNFGRIKDKAIDDALVQLRVNPDAAARQAAAQTVNKRHSELVTNFWSTWTLWAIIGDPELQNVGGGNIPGTDTAIEPSNTRPQHWLHQLWLKQ
jgi:peptide/nickel transport system substrate-binding protein